MTDLLGFETPTIRVRPFEDGDFEIREEGDGLTFSGYAAVFNSPSEDLGGFREFISPGAFARSINSAANGKRTIKMFLNHNQDIVLASTRAKTLSLVEDQRGLHATARFPANATGQYAADAVKRGDIDSMSFGFNVEPKGDSWSDDRTERTLHAIRLWEVSPVTGWPAYPATTASVRHLADMVEVEAGVMADALKALVAEDGTLTEEQRDLLMKAINARIPSRFVPAELAERQARLAALIERTEAA